jgi:dTDP-4-dehydrorhamnose 3,5-epimerase
MALEFIETGISGLTVIKAHCYNDGSFSLKKFFQKGLYEKAGLPADFSEANIVAYKKGTLRGLHYQKAPSQGKLVFVLTGSVFIAAVDLREGSKTFGGNECFNLSLAQDRALYVPGLFALGVLALEENTALCYNCTGEYLPEKCGGLIWNDPDLNISWPVSEIGFPPALSAKDEKLQSFYAYRAKR